MIVRHVRQPVAPLVVALALTSLVIAACAADEQAPGSPDDVQVIDAGVQGRLNDRRVGKGSALVVPQNIKLKPAFPLGSTVKFSIPIANGSDAPLVIRRLEPG